MGNYFSPTEMDGWMDGWIDLDDDDDDDDDDEVLMCALCVEYLV